MVSLYTTPTCGYCRVAKDFLKKNSVKFQEYNVASDQAKAQEMVRKSGQMGVPVLDINGTVIVGFNQPAIERALKG